MGDIDTKKQLDDAREQTAASSKRSEAALTEMARLGVVQEDARKADDERRAADDGRRAADDDRRVADDSRRDADDKRRAQQPPTP